MKITFAILFTSIFLNLSNKVNAQNIALEKIEFASFKIVHTSKKKDSVRVDLYSTIDKKGLITILNDDDYHHTLSFGTYQLSAIQLQKIVSIFNGKIPLKNYMVKKRLDEGSFYGGTNYYFVSVNYKNKDSLCFIPGFMSSEFFKAYEMLRSIFYDKENLKKINRFSISQSFKNSLLSTYKKSTYLPKIKPLPFSFRLEDQH